MRAFGPDERLEQPARAPGRQEHPDLLAVGFDRDARAVTGIFGDRDHVAEPQMGLAGQHAAAAGKQGRGQNEGEQGPWHREKL